MTALHTDTEFTGPAAVVVRPQPLGTFPLPLGYMLIPAVSSTGADTEAARTALLSGNVPEEWPEGLSAHELALAGDREAALAVLDGTDPVTRYNRFVLDPDSEDPDELRCALDEFGPLVDLVLFVLGRSDTPPEVGSADGELAAVALSAQASQVLDEGDSAGAVVLLERAATAAGQDSRRLQGVLVGAAAAIRRELGDPSAAERLEQALRLLDGADGLRIGRAELHLNLAGLLHERAEDHPELLAQAIPHYHSALQLVLRDEAPLLWAATHANLATAYLTMPMVEASGQLRLGVAAQSLRSALKVYTRETHPEQWASVQLNLANSLVYTPSKHQADNLVEAVELYEGVLQARDRDTDPLGRARVLSNQGNALAHLGMFDQAKAKLYEARFLFEELADEESVRAVRGVLDEIARQQALIRTAPAPD
ncbi:TPR repeat-containing protein [uncultured Mycobacterium sp.]|uniref:TPR repeat-containing protein n=1 Tax=uncultured Mycobacterium sp. TaxID=171292 RepID=A0A1Y5PGJ6_9MYCO|nr:TPR repeat-containing protein [uncultured Mycobacterium sp.]